MAGTLILLFCLTMVPLIHGDDNKPSSPPTHLPTIPPSHAPTPETPYPTPITFQPTGKEPLHSRYSLSFFLDSHLYANRQRHRHACLRRRPHRRPRYPHSCHHPFRLSCRQHRHRRTRPHRPQRLFHGFRVSFLLRCLLMLLRRCPASNPLTHQRLLLLRRYLRRLLQLRSLRHGALGSCSAAVLKTRIGTCSGNINM